MNNKNRTLLPFFIVTLQNDELNQCILNVKYLLNMAVRVIPNEPMHKPLQCYNCQEFNHGASHCHRRTACLRCAGEHSHKQCPTKCTGDNCINCRCANFGDNHPPISPNCPKRPKRNSSNSESKQPTRGISSSTQRKLGGKSHRNTGNNKTHPRQIPAPQSHNSLYVPTQTCTHTPQVTFNEARANPGPKRNNNNYNNAN
jgi:hypothetical protein